MPAQLRIVLTEEQDRTLRELRQAAKVPQRVKERAHMLRLNAQGRSTAEIASIFECHAHTVRNAVQRWEDRGLQITSSLARVRHSAGAIRHRDFPKHVNLITAWCIAARAIDESDPNSNER